MIGRSLFEDGMIQEIEMTVTQVATAPTPIGALFTVLEGERAYLLQMVVGPDNYAAGRNLDIVHRTSSNYWVNYIANADGLDNSRLILPTTRTKESQSSDTTETFILGVGTIPTLLVGGDSIRVEGASLADGETITIIARFLVHSDLLDITKVDGDETHTITTNEVIA